MRKLFISADIEGTCGITDWAETEKGHADHHWFADQMTREVAAACQGAEAAGIDLVLVKDAHDSARNLDPRGLPRLAQVLRGWAGDPLCMMMGLDDSFDGAVFTGYHHAAGRDSNPLAHTMSTSLFSVTINGEIASELHINCLIASYLGVPVRALSGDSGLCAWLNSKLPAVPTVATNEGVGGSVRSIHPDEALRLIREAVEKGLQLPREACLFPLPEHFVVEVCYREHKTAHRKGFYPGVTRVDERTIRFEHDDYYEVLRMMHFCL